MTNNTTVSYEDDFVVIRQICQYFVLVSSVIGNTILIVILIKLRRLKTFVDKLILNLALCNLMLVVVSIPTGLIMDGSGDAWPFGYVGCKFIDPLSTYAVNTGTFTLLVIAFERWRVVKRPFSTPSSKKKKVAVMLCLHMFGVLSVLPYIIVLSHSVDQTNTPKCTETWSMTSSRIYTVVLFVLQYGLPVPIMLAFYGRAWSEIKHSDQSVFQSLTTAAHNTQARNNAKTSINDSPRENLYRKFSRARMYANFKLDSENKTYNSYTSSTTLSIADEEQKTFVNKLNKGNVQRTAVSKKETRKVSFGNASYRLGRESIRSNRWNRDSIKDKGSIMDKHRTSIMCYISPSAARKMARSSSQNKAIRNRLNRSRDLLKMFTAVVLVFVVFMLPNQILWLMIDFGSNGDEYFNPLVRDVVHILTYANCVLNPIIYGRLNKNFRRDFKKLFAAMTFSKKEKHNGLV